MPVKRQTGFLIIYNLLLLVWIAMMVGGVILTIRTAFSGERYAFVFTVLLLILLFILYRFGSFLRWQWGFYTANREILYLNKERLIIRRPVSIFGPTDAYDMQHVSPFYTAGATGSPAFKYGNHEVLFGQALAAVSARQLVDSLNRLYFPDHEDEVDGE